jgi:hypothetical protein
LLAALRRFSTLRQADPAPTSALSEYGEPMITEIVFFDLPEGISRDELMSKYMSTAKAWSENTDLIQKYYLGLTPNVAVLAEF